MSHFADKKEKKLKKNCPFSKVNDEELSESLSSTDLKIAVLYLNPTYKKWFNKALRGKYRILRRKKRVTGNQRRACQTCIKKNCRVKYHVILRA